ncbi:uncharacterized protein LOC133806386 [Humulus lupulus]|uniref:uncharacterized protein LOC133806386 n=1 Tax=Humulus lupulus TaxID=3486 RepID=UPI002B403644|nr:uncharacterized protein LOC133806386 [Humulus lupulus]
MAIANNLCTGGRPLPQIPEEHTPRTEEYPRQPGKQAMVDPDPEERSDSSNSRGPPAPRPDEDLYYNPKRYVPIVELENRQLRKQLAEATKRNEELSRQAADTQAPPRRPRGRPRGSTTARRAEQASQPNQPRPRRSTWAEATVNPTAKLPTGTGNNRAPLVAQNPNPNTARNNLEPVWANSRPSGPDNGRQPPLPIRHSPSPIRHPSPVREVLRPAPRRPSRSGSQDGNRQARPGQGSEREATRDYRAPQPSGSQMSRSKTAETRRPTGESPRNHRATPPERATSYVSEARTTLGP